MEYLIYLNNEPVRRINGDDAAGTIYADMWRGWEERRHNSFYSSI